MTTVAFIGLGNMGGPMAANLVKGGHQVTVFDLAPTALAQAQAAGCAVAESAGAAAAQADVVITMLPAGQHVEAVYLGRGEQAGLIETLAKNTLVIDCSTIAAETAQQLGHRLSDAGLRFIDAPVSGGVGGAKAGTLTFICGGAQADVDAARPVLECMGKNVFRAGDTGAGQIAKICNNM